MITCSTVTITEGIIINDWIRTAQQEFPGFWVQMMIYIISPVSRCQSSHCTKDAAVTHILPLMTWCRTSEAPLNLTWSCVFVHRSDIISHLIKQSHKCTRHKKVLFYFYFFDRRLRSADDWMGFVSPAVKAPKTVQPCLWPWSSAWSCSTSMAWRRRSSRRPWTACAGRLPSHSRQRSWSRLHIASTLLHFNRGHISAGKFLASCCRWASSLSPLGGDGVRVTIARGSVCPHL